MQEVLVPHKKVAAQCFNATWTFIDSTNLSKEQTEEMLHLAHASFWHWTQVPDHTPLNLSIGYWQLSRVYAKAEHGERAIYYAERCLQVSQKHELEPFYIAYAFEALSRSHLVSENVEKSKENLVLALQVTEEINNEEYKEMIKKDLDDLQEQLNTR